MEVITVNRQPKTTADCIAILNAYKPGKWKRIQKVKLSENEVRTFENENNEFYTLVSQEGEDAKMYVDLDFRTILPVVQEINNLSKFYYTYDYGDIWLDPIGMRLLIEGGDGGYSYSTKPKKEAQKELEDLDGDQTDFIDFDAHPSLSSHIKEVEWADEYSPDDPEYFKIGAISLLDI